MDYKIRTLKTSDKKTLTHLLDTCFDITAKKSEEVIEWKFYNGGEVVSRVAINEDGKIISFYCNKEIEVVKENQKFKTGLCLDMATDPKYRGKGLISKLSKKVYQQVRSKNFKVSIGFSNKYGIKVDKFSKNYGYSIVGQFKQYYKPVIRIKESRYQVELTKKFIKPVEFEDVYQIGFSKKYLNWRFKQIPEKNYMVLNIKEKNNVVAQVVTRKNNIKLEILKILKVDDDFDLDHVLGAINNYALKNGSKIIVLSLFEKSKWDKNMRYNHYLQLPHRKKYYLTVKFHTQKIDEKSMLDPKNWLLMGGDVL